MAGTRELRQRIRSVGNIKQITRAMEMVATTKLRKFQDRAVASRPYAEEIGGLVRHLASVLGGDLGERPLFREGEGERVAVLFVTSERGLCGAYNSNLFRTLEQHLAEHAGTRHAFFVYGRKGYRYLARREHEIERLFVDPELEKIDYRGAAAASKTLVEAFLAGQFRRVRILSTAFHTMTRYEPRWVDLLPIEPDGFAEEDTQRMTDVILEPDAATIFDRLIPRYLETLVYNALVEAISSEYASRRVAMKNATDAAGDMQLELKAIYNRKRQEGITKDLLDIVGGVEALR